MNCNCIGPQNGQPLCPCQMQNVKVVDGRYVFQQDLGPVVTVHDRVKDDYEAVLRAASL